ncbi:MAG TPA: ABC transporter permease [Bryobacteraceae bacterium]|jgi:ABC-2 type transport system permease protein|nr:ABC transporter permease [Bryobacteraceae bacterium]
METATAYPAGRAWRAYVVEAKYESLRMLRAPAFAGPFLVLPAALFLLFGVLLFGPEIAKDPKTAWFMFLGFSILGVMGPGLFGFGIVVATEREHGLLQLRRALPAPLSAPLLAMMLMSMLFVAIIMASMAAVAPLAHLYIPVLKMLALAMVCILSSAPFCAMGFLIGSLASAKSAPALVNVLYLPMIYLSGILIPLPKSAAWIAHLSPAYHLDQLALTSLGAPHEGSWFLHVAVLAAITVVFTALAVRQIARRG